MMSDFVRYPRHVVEEVASHPGPLFEDRSRVLSARNVDPVKLATLESLLTGDSYDVILKDRTRFANPIGGEDPDFDGTCLVCPLSAQLLGGLGAADEPKLRSLAARWARTEEWEMDGGTAENLTPFLNALAAMAREAEAAGEGVFLIILV